MTLLREQSRVLTRTALRCLVALCLCSMSALTFGEEIKVSLKGENEVPPVTTGASGTGMFTIGPDGTVTGSVTTNGIASTVAHIHVGPAGKIGPVIIPLRKSSDNDWVVTPGAKLTEAQINNFKAKELYVNVHSKAHPGGEIRAQLAD